MLHAPKTGALVLLSWMGSAVHPSLWDNTLPAPEPEKGLAVVADFFGQPRRT